MIEQATEFMQIVRNHYLDVENLKIEQIVELDKPIDYLIDKPHQAVKITFNSYCSLDTIKESIADAIADTYGFRIAIIKNKANIITQLLNNNNIECLLVF